MEKFIQEKFMPTKFEEIKPLDLDDLKCMKAIKKVLEEHGKVDKFGLTLLHRHFDVSESEVLVEKSDAARRTTTQSVFKRSDPQIDDAVDTSWYLGTEIPSTLGKCRSLWHADQK